MFFGCPKNCAIWSPNQLPRSDPAIGLAAWRIGGKRKGACRAFLPLLLLAACGKQERPKVFQEPPEIDRVKMVAECMEVLRAFGTAVVEQDDEAVGRLSHGNYRSCAAVSELFADPAVERLCAAALGSDPKRVTFHDHGCKIRLERDGTTFTFNMWHNDKSGYFVRRIRAE